MGKGSAHCRIACNAHVCMCVCRTLCKLLINEEHKNIEPKFSRPIGQVTFLSICKRGNQYVILRLHFYSRIFY